MIRFPSEDGRSGDERGISRAPFNQGPAGPQAISNPPGERDGSNQATDLFPGNCNYLELLKSLQANVAKSEIHVWDYHAKGTDLVDPVKRQGVKSREYSQQALATHLAERFFTIRGPDVGTPGAWLDASDRVLTQTNAEWMDFSGSQSDLTDAIRDALATPAGFVDGRAGWTPWAGVHWGLWIQGDTTIDVAIWEAPTTVAHSKSDTDCADRPDISSRHYDFQPVRWYKYDAAGRATYKHRGWNQSHPELPYIWGWDPKNLGKQLGTRGVHVGYPFALPGFAFIVWVCFTEIFLECVATDTVRSGRLRYAAGAKAIWNIDGRAKTSTREKEGRGQWLVRARNGR